MILFTLGLSLEEFKSYPRGVTAGQKAATTHFLKALDSGDDKQKQDALHTILFTLFVQKNKGSQYNLTVYRFLILHSFRREGNLAWSGVITQDISAIVFFGRGTIFNKIRSVMALEKSGFFEYVIYIHSSSTPSDALDFLGFYLPTKITSSSNLTIHSLLFTSPEIFSRNSAKTMCQLMALILLMTSKQSSSMVPLSLSAVLGSYSTNSMMKSKIDGRSYSWELTWKHLSRFKKPYLMNQTT